MNLQSPVLAFAALSGLAWNAPPQEGSDPDRRTAVEVDALVNDIASTVGSADAQALGVALQVAYDEFLLQHDAFDTRNARALAEAMYGAQPATWSAFCLEGIARRGGDSPRAESVLTERLTGTPEGPARIEIFERRAIARGGAGDAQGAQADLGRALVLGGTDSCQILGLQALNAGRLEESRDLFRVLLERAEAAPAASDPPPWALRGWALTLISRVAPTAR